MSDADTNLLWLEDAIERVIEATGDHYEYTFMIDGREETVALEEGDIASPLGLLPILVQNINQTAKDLQIPGGVIDGLSVVHDDDGLLGLRVVLDEGTNALSVLLTAIYDRLRLLREMNPTSTTLNLSLLENSRSFTESLKEALSQQIDTHKTMN